MKVAITGGEGFLGREVVRLFKKQGHSVTLLDRKKESLFNPSSLERFVRNKDVIIHLAGVNRDVDSEIVKGNVYVTSCLLSAIKKYNQKAIIIFSSSAQVYTNTLYGISKKMAENLIAYYSKNYDLKAVILRIANIYGPNGRPYYNSAIATFIDQIKKRKPITVNGNGKQKRDFIYVSDVAKAVMLAASKREKQPLVTVDICSGTLVSLDKIIRTLYSLAKEKENVTYLSKNVMSEYQTKKNYKKAYSLFNWKPETPLIMGLKAALNMYES